MSDPVAPNAPTRPWWDLPPERVRLLALGLIFVATLPMLTKIFTSDFGTHIAIGRQIVQTRSIPDKEFLNYPSVGIDSPNPVWLFQAVLYLVFSLGGAYAVSFLLWAITFGIFLLLHRAMVLRGAHPLLAVAALFAFSGFLRIRIQPRPEIFTYFFIASTIFLLTEYYFGRRRRLVYLFPPLMLLWANCHPSYLMGLLLCGAFFLDALIRSAWKKELSLVHLRTWVVPPLVTAAAGLFLCGLNPMGYDSILAPIYAITRGAGGASGRADAVMMSISELTPVRGTGFFVYYKAALAAVAVSLILGTYGRKVFLLDLLLFAISFKGAWDSARAVSMMGLFLSPGISLHVTGFLERVREGSAERERSEAARREKERGKGKAGGKAVRQAKAAERVPVPPAAARPAHRWLRPAAGVLLGAAFLLFGGITLGFSFSQLEYGVGMTEHKFSFGAADFLRKNRIPGKMFNFFDIGGFLDWQLYPEALTFIDGRTYSASVFMEHQTVTSGMAGWQEVLKKYGVTYVVTKAMDSSGMILPLIPALANNPDWVLVFSDGLFVVFVRNIPENQALIARHRLPGSALPYHIIREAYHYMYLGISPVIAYQTMSNMYMLLGNRSFAAQMLRNALSEVDDPTLRVRLSQIEQGGSPPARTHP